MPGSLGCEERPAGECWGLGADFTYRIAVIDTENGTLVVSERDPADAGPIDYTSFDTMLASLHFPEDDVPPTEPVIATAVPHQSDPSTSRR